MEMLRKFVKYFSVHFVAPRKRRLKRTFMYKCQMYQLTWLHLHTQMFNLNATLYFSAFFFLHLSSFNLVFFLLKSLQFNGIPVPPLHSTPLQLYSTSLQSIIVVGGCWDMGQMQCKAEKRNDRGKNKFNKFLFKAELSQPCHYTSHIFPEQMGGSMETAH